MTKDQAIEAVRAADDDWTKFSIRADRRMAAGGSLPPNFVEREQKYVKAFDAAVKMAEELGLPQADWQE